MWLELVGVGQHQTLKDFRSWRTNRSGAPDGELFKDLTGMATWMVGTQRVLNYLTDILYILFAVHTRKTAWDQMKHLRVFMRDAPKRKSLAETENQIQEKKKNSNY